jgi:hypothetical protein
MEPVLVRLGQILHGVHIYNFNEIYYFDDVEIIVADDLVRA